MNKPKCYTIYFNCTATGSFGPVTFVDKHDVQELDLIVEVIEKSEYDILKEQLQIATETLEIACMALGDRISRDMVADIKEALEEINNIGKEK